MWGIRIAIGPIPALLLIAGIIFAIRYPLNQKEYQRIVNELEQKHSAESLETA